MIQFIVFVLAALAASTAVFGFQHKVDRTMVSEEEFERIMLMAHGTIDEPTDDVTFQKIVDQYPDVFAEQERRNETEHAIHTNDLELLKKNVTESPEYLNKLFCGNPLIQRAAQHGNLEACKILLSAGADINQLSSSRTSVLALAELSPPLVAYLLEAGADPNNRNVFHVFTTYQTIPEETRLEIVKLFVKHSLDINRAYLMFDDLDAPQTVLDFIGNRYPTIRQFLLENGAKHGHELVKTGAYDSANEYLSYEKLEDLRRQVKAKAASNLKGGD